MREEIGMRLISYQDFVNTRLLEFEDEMDEVVEQGNQLLRAFHQHSHIPQPSALRINILCSFFAISTSGLQTILI